VMSYGCPADGLMYCQLAGWDAQNADLKCVCELYSLGEVKDADMNMQVACTEGFIFEN
jgi:hypothetical protein